MINLYQYCIEYFKHAPTIIQLSWTASGVLFGTIVVLVSYLKHLRTMLRNKGRIQATYQKKYEADLIEYLYSGNEDEEISEKQQIIVNYLKKCSTIGFGSSLKRKIIISTLLKLRNEVSGETADSIQKLYYQIGFISQASLRLKSKKWDVVARSIRELAQFEIKEAHDEVLLHINHKKREVRREIRFYLVKLFGFEGLEFLNIIKNQLSEWDQIQILEILKNSENQKLPDISDWLQSSNDSVISFALKLAKIYNQFEAKGYILELLNHSNLEIRIQAMEIVSHIGFFEVVEILKDKINERSLDEQIAFFSMDENLLITLGEDFMMDYVNHENFEIRMSAKNILKLLDIHSSNTIDIDRVKNDIAEIDSLIKAS